MTKWLLFPFALTFIACGPPVRGAIDASGFAHKNYELKVASVDEARLMPEGWLLDNYFEHKSWGRRPKTGDDYKLSYKLDFDGDGEFETSADEFVYDLRFEHKRHDGTIFLRTIPISTDQAEKKLRVLLHRYVEAVAGAGYEMVDLGETSVMVEKRYAVTVSDKKETKLAGREALFARLEVANIDQIRIDPGARMAHVAFVLAHTKFKYTTNLVEEAFPVLLLVGYANQPEDFDEGLKDFHEFLSRISIDGKTGYTPPAVETSADKTTTETKQASTDSEPENSTEAETPKDSDADETESDFVAKPREATETKAEPATTEKLRPSERK